MSVKKVIFIVLAVLICYVIWSQVGRNNTEKYSYKPVADFVVFKKDSSKTNIIGIQTFMTNLDYQSAQSFYDKLAFYLDEAKVKNWIQSNTVVVFPEHVASWLVAAGEKSSVFKAATIDAAMRTIVLTHLPQFLWKNLTSSAEDKSKDAVFQMKANQMAKIYQDVFSRLAINYKVTIVAGSIFLPKPFLEAGTIKIGKGAIYNMSAVFNSDGQIMAPLILKKFPTVDELPFCKPSFAENKVYKTAQINIGVLICADAWFPKNYQELSAQNSQVLVVPAYSTGVGLWAKKWKGYTGFNGLNGPPKDIDLNDIGAITEGEAWHKYTLIRSRNAGIKTAIAVFLRGNIWNLGTDGQSFIWQNNQLKSVPKTEGAVLFNVEI